MSAVTDNTMPEIQHVEDAIRHAVAQIDVRARVAGTPPTMAVEGGHIRPTWVSIRYETQTSQRGWKIERITVIGRRVEPDGTPQAGRLPGNETTTVVVNAQDAPEWLATVVATVKPATVLAIGVPEMIEYSMAVAPHTALDDLVVGDVRLVEVESIANIRLRLSGLWVHNADTVVLPGHGEGREWYLRVDNLAIEYLWGALTKGVWGVLDIEVTGSVTGEEGTTRGRAPVSPQWAQDYADRHLPDYVWLLAEESGTDTELREFLTANAWYHRLGERRNEAEESNAGESTVNRLCERQDDAAEGSSEAAERLIYLLNDGAPLPRAWADNPRPDTTTQEQTPASPGDAPQPAG